jgi:hypothetical protein
LPTGPAKAEPGRAAVFPNTAAHAKLFEQLRQNIVRQHGTGFVLNVPSFPPEVSETVVQRFRADRAREYDEFAECCAALLDEIGKETRAGKYTFAEMEECGRTWTSWRAGW